MALVRGNLESIHPGLISYIYVQYAIGDTIMCKIRGSSIIVASTEPHDAQLPFQILSLTDDRYLLAVPPYFFIKNSWNVKEEHLDKYRLDAKYLDTKVINVTPDKILGLFKRNELRDGMTCRKCHEYVGMAESNQPDGSFICWLCRQNIYR